MDLPSPVQSEKQESSCSNEQQATNGVNRPHNLFQRHPWILRVALGPVEDEETSGACEVEGSLHLPLISTLRLRPSEMHTQYMPRQPEGLALVTPPAPRPPTNPPTAPPRNAKPLASALYLSGSTSDGIACTMEIVDRVTPIRMPPPINIAILVALAEMMAPTKAISGGTAARYLRSSTSDSLPTKGESTLCINNGP